MFKNKDKNISENIFSNIREQISFNTRKNIPEKEAREENSKGMGRECQGSRIGRGNQADRKGLQYRTGGGILYSQRDVRRLNRI